MIGRLGTIALLLSLAVAPARAAQELGLNVHQSTGVGLAVAHDAQVKWVRIDLNWLDAQPSSGAPDFTLFDTQVANAQAKGLSVLAVLAYTPAWASTGDGKGDGPNNDVPTAGSYAAFVTTVVQHFAGKIDHYELWNEPNLAQFWEGTTQQYIDLILKPGADAVHAACASCSVVGPALASVGTEYANWMDAVLAQAKDKIDIVSGHVYAGFPSSTVGVTSDSFFNKLDAHRVVTVGGATIYQGPLSYREEMIKNGATQPFWLTETGLEAPYGDAAKEDAQRTYYYDVLQAMQTRPWWGATVFYEAFDEPGSGYTWGVALDDPAAAGGYDAKPVLALLQAAAVGSLFDGGVPDDGGVTGDAAAPADAGANADGNGNGNGNGNANGNANANGNGNASAGGCDVAPVAPLGGMGVLLLFGLAVLRFRR